MLVSNKTNLYSRISIFVSNLYYRFLNQRHFNMLVYNFFYRDFDAAETVKEKVNKLLDVKGVRGLSKLMKEIAVTASSGKHDNELIGRAVITLKV